MSNKIPLSIVVIYNSKAKNSYLEKLKKSVKDFDEIILFDVGSSPIRDFAKIRNEAIKKAKNDYVMYIDSDEVLKKSSVILIKKIISEKKYDLVSVNRKDIFLGKQLNYGEAGSSHLVRLGKKDKLVFSRAVHETVMIKSDYKMIGSDITLMHYSHLSISSFIEKVSRYSHLESILRKQKPDLGLLFELLFFPPLKFLYNYLIRQGYRDGIRGFVYAVVMSLHSLFVRINLFEKYAKK